MGAKISVDSATMMNKGLEMIEAHHLFAMPEAAIEVVVHPQSIVHSLVAFTDGSVLAQLGEPDMRIPIAYTLGWPGRLAHHAHPSSTCAPRSGLDFEPPDLERFPALAAGPARLAAGRGGTYCTERRERGGGGGVPRPAGSAFSTSPVPWRQVLERLAGAACDDLDAVLAYDAEARRVAAEIAGLRPAPAWPLLKEPEGSMLATIVQYLIPFLLVLSVVVFVHEFGHYWVARRNGVRVEVFSIGFGPELFGRNDRHGTRWKFSAVPARRLRQDAGRRRRRQCHRRSARTAREPDSFPAKSVWQRMAIVAAGPMANFVFAIVALAILFAAVGRPFTPAEVGAVQPDSPAAAAGLAARRPDHRASTARRSRASRSCRRSCATVRASRCRSCIDRDGEPLELTVTPAASEIEDRFGNRHQVGLIGVSRAGVEYRRSNPFLAAVRGHGRDRAG